MVHKVGESEINYIKIFQSAKALSISVGNSNTEDQMMETLLKIYRREEVVFSDRNPPIRIEERRKSIDQKS